MISDVQRLVGARGQNILLKSLIECSRLSHLYVTFNTNFWVDAHLYIKIPLMSRDTAHNPFSARHSFNWSTQQFFPIALQKTYSDVLLKKSQQLSQKILSPLRRCSVTSYLLWRITADTRNKKLKVLINFPNLLEPAF